MDGTGGRTVVDDVVDEDGDIFSGKSLKKGGKGKERNQRIVMSFKAH